MGTDKNYSHKTGEYYDIQCYLSDLFITCHNVDHQLRSNHRKLYLDEPKTNYLRKSFSYRGAVSWNSLPNEILDGYDQLCVHSFKTLLRNHYSNSETNLQIT